MAVVEFADKESALKKVSDLIVEIQETLSQPREQIENIGFQLVSDYDLQRQYIAKADKRIEEDVEDYKNNKRSDVPAMYVRYIAGQIYNELGNEKRARELLEPVYLSRNEWKNPTHIRFIEGLWAELNGDLAEARKAYEEIKDEPQFKQEYYLRMAHDEIQLRRRLAELELVVEGDAVVERYAREAEEKKGDPVSAEVASALVTEKLKLDSIKKIHALIPPAKTVGVAADSQASEADWAKIGNLTFNFDDLAMKIDFSCEETLDRAGLLASLAAEEGELETLGNVYLNLGMPEKAVKIMEKALKLRVKVKPIVYYQLAGAYLLAGHYKDWQKYTQLFLKKSGEFTEAKVVVKDK